METLSQRRRGKGGMADGVRATVRLFEGPRSQVLALDRKPYMPRIVISWWQCRNQRRGAHEPVASFLIDLFLITLAGCCYSVR